MAEEAERNLIDASFWFLCSLQRKNGHHGSPSGAFQIHEAPVEIVVSGVPSSEVSGGRPTANLLLQAEFAFLKEAKVRMLNHHVIGWVARFGHVGGAVLSEFAVYLSADQD